MLYEIVLWKDGEPSEVHKIELTYSDEQWYTSSVSLSSFRRRENERLFKRYTKGFRDVIGKRCDVRTEAGMHGYFVDFKLILPVFEHKTVWDFYKAIGYDYKRKKYL